MHNSQKGHYVHKVHHRNMFKIVYTKAFIANNLYVLESKYKSR